jgi:hypothetical protein
MSLTSGEKFALAIAVMVGVIIVGLLRKRLSPPRVTAWDRISQEAPLAYGLAAYACAYLGVSVAYDIVSLQMPSSLADGSLYWRYLFPLAIVAPATAIRWAKFRRHRASATKNDSSEA